MSDYQPFVLPLRTPLYDSSRLTRPWYEFLTAVANKAGRSLTWRGLYDAGQNYSVNDLVRMADYSLWVANQANPVNGSAVTPGTDATVWEPVIPAADTSGSAEDRVLGVVIDGGGSTPATGSKGFLQVPYACTITGWTLLADQAGSAQITVKRCTYAAFPTTASIVASAQPKLTSAQKATSSTLTGWTVDLAKGDVLEFNLDSITTIQRLILELQVTKS